MAWLQLQSGDPRTIRARHRLVHVRESADGDVRERLHAASHARLEKGPARQCAGHATLELTAIAAVGVPPHVGPHVPKDGASVAQVVPEVREETLEDPEPLREQRVHMASVRLALSGHGVVHDRVALEDGHPVEVAAQHARGEQAGHARAGNHRMLSLHLGHGRQAACAFAGRPRKARPTAATSATNVTSRVAATAPPFRTGSITNAAWKVAMMIARV